MDKIKRNKIIVITIIVIALVISALYYILTFTTNEENLSILENKWITSNTNNIIDVDIYNDIPIYGYNGSGVCFDFLDSFTKKYGINFSKRSYYSSSKIEYDTMSFKIIEPNQKVKEEDILLYEDEYVIVGKNNIKASPKNISKLGILIQNKEYIVDFLGKNKEYIEHQTITELITSLNNGTVDYIAIPNVMYATEILSNKLNILYHLNDLSQKYVLSVKDETLRSIMKKHYITYKKNGYKDDYSKEFLQVYFNATNTIDVLRKSYNSKIYKYGYVINMPYENISNSSFVGTISNYLINFEKVANVEIQTIKYNTIDDLKSALVNGDIDIAITNFDDTKINMDNIKTLAFKDEDYLVISQKNIPITSIKGLKEYKVSVIGSSNLHHLCINNGVETNTFNDSDDLIRNVNNDDIIIIDKDMYYYYKDQKLSNFKVIYEDTIPDAYKFIINKNSETFAQIFNYYLELNDYNHIKYNYNTEVMIKEENKNVRIITITTILLLLIIVAILLYNKKKNKGININHNDMMRYIDPTTSLKNRAYLNNNIYNWDDNVIFPQSIIVYDIDKLREINDKFGREEGDEVIKQVAAILINNQLENTEIIRSDGDEFIIYMIGYNKERTEKYAKKLAAEMKNIPNLTNVSLGYSMILDEVKTIDDAINESITMLKKNRDKR